MTASVENWAQQVRAGDVRAISRAVSAIENRDTDAEPILRRLLDPHGGLIAAERTVVVATHHLPDHSRCPELRISADAYPDGQSSNAAH